MAGHKSYDIRVDLIIRISVHQYESAARYKVMNDKTDNYFCEELEITGIEMTINLNGSNIWKVS